MLNTAKAQSIQMKQETLFKFPEKDVAINPLSAAVTDDGHFLLAGEAMATQKAFAAKFDSSGKALWIYRMGLLPEDVSKLHGVGQHPKFTGIVPMPDGTTYLCGTMPRPPSEYAPGFLVHLDATGVATSTQLFLPHDRNPHGIARLNDCVRWGDGIAIVGQVFHVVRKDEAKAPIKPGVAYWVVILDKAGNRKYETQIRSTLVSNSPEVGPIIAAPESNASLIFVAKDSFATEIVRVGEKGEVQAQKKLDGTFLLVQPTSPDKLLQVHGFFRAKSPPVRAVTLTLNEKLEESKRVEGALPDTMESLLRIAYRMPDQSLVLFGSKSQGGPYTSRILHVTADLSAQDAFEFPKTQLFDNGSIWAASALDRTGTFVVARTAIALDNDPKHPELPGKQPNFKRGAQINIMNISGGVSSPPSSGKADANAGAKPDVAISTATSADSSRSNPGSPDWMVRRKKFYALLHEKNPNNPTAISEANQAMLKFAQNPLAMTPLEGMDVTGVGMRIVKLDKAMSEVAMWATWGWFDVLQWASPSGIAEILNNERFFLIPFLLGGKESTKDWRALIQSNPEEAKKIVERGIAGAKANLKKTSYDHKWPTAFGLEKMINAAKNQPDAPSIAKPNMSADDAWAKAADKVRSYYLTTQ